MAKIDMKSGTVTQWCNKKFDVIKADGYGLPPGVLSFTVPSTKPGDSTMARMGDAGFLELIYRDNAVKFDGSPIRPLNNEQAPIFVPRITPTGRGNGPETISINVTFTAD